MALRSVGQLGQVPVERQCLGVCQRIGVFHRAPMHHVSNRQLDDFATDGARDILDLDNLCRHMTRRRVFPVDARETYASLR